MTNPWKSQSQRCMCLVLIVATLAVGIADRGEAAVLSVSPELRTEVVSPRMVQRMTPRGIQVVQDLAASGQILVQLDALVSAEQFEEILQRQNCSTLHYYQRYNLALVKLPPGVTVSQAVQQWQGQPGVAAAEPDRLMYPTIVPNDPRYSEQYQWEITSAPEAWDEQRGSAQTIIAIVDSGVQLDHPDLQSKIWVNSGEIPGNSLDDDGNGFIDDVNGWDFIDNNNDPNPSPNGEDEDENGIPDDTAAHGTHCAGLAAAATNNAVGVAGYDWQARIMPVQIFPDDGATTTSIVLEGFQYAADNGADVISLSLRGMYSEVWTEPIADAYQQGIVVVAAAGNEAWVFTDDPNTWMSPVCNDGPMFTDNYVLGVAASDQYDQAAFFTNRDASSRNFVDVVAPGVDILSTWLYSPDLPGFEEQYARADGTSMSTPITAGLCGLIRAQFPAMGPEGVIKQIRAGCDNIDEENPQYAGTLGAGRINGVNCMGDIPPGAPRGVMAYDTPGDEGGSITVAWSLSTDDGRGFNDVVGYEVFKADSHEGPFSSLAALPAGNSYCVDEPVDDNIPYYYKVAVSDASSVVESAVAGPAAARDDLPPDPVENVTATDTADDEGASISVSWEGYQAPEDFEQFCVYRGTADFTEVSAMMPIAEISSRSRQTYVDETTMDGVQYWYAVTATDDEDNEDTSVTAAGPAVSYPNFTFDYPIGLSMVSIGADPPTGDMAEILGITPSELKLARWDPVLADYQQYDPAIPMDPATRHQLGRAFWLRTTNPLTVGVAGMPAPTGDYEIALAPGWNMVGNPYSAAIDFSTAKIITGGTEVDLNTSNQKGYTANYAWGYAADTNSYKLISGAFSAKIASPALEKGQGVFFYSEVSGSLKIVRPVGALAANPQVVTESAPTANNWSLRLVAQASGTADIDNFLGISPQAAQLNNVISPPPAQPGVDLYFTAPDRPNLRQAADFVTASGARQNWDIAVDCSIPGAEVELSWPDLTTMPSSIKPVLTDLSTGQSVYLRTTTAYRYQATNAGVRRLQLSISELGSLNLTNVTTAATPAGGAQVTFTLSAPGQASLEILNISGRPVRQVVAGRTYPAGTAQVLWDGRNGAGALVPAGTYLVRVTAHADNGQQVSALRPLSIGR